MQMPTDLKSSYDAVLRDLEAERDERIKQVAEHQGRIRELNVSISTLYKRLNTDNTPSATSGEAILSHPANQKYASLSVRWAILDMMANSEPKSTAEIADALINLGVQTKAANFANNVSAVLSTTMKEHHNEVEQLPDGKWCLTENGRSAIEHIRTTSRFQSALRGPRPYARL